MNNSRQELPQANSVLEAVIRFCLLHKVVVGLLLLATIGWGITVSPFDPQIDGLVRDPVPVDAIQIGRAHV